MAWLLSLILLASTAPSQPTYTVHPTTAPIQIDGRLDEWHAVPATEKLINVLGKDHPAPPYPTQCKVTRDDKNLYIAAELLDEDVTASIKEKNVPLSPGNCFEVLIDPDGDGLNYWEIQVNALNTTMSLLMDKPYSAGGHPVAGKHLEHLKAVVHVDGTLNDQSDRDRGWTVEIVVPFEDLGVTPKPGDDWRINFARVHFRAANDPTYAAWSPTGAINYHMPEKFGHLRFSE